MQTPKVYAAAQCWSSVLIDALRGHAAGIILGDLFCQKRMFAHEWFDILELAQTTRELGFQVIFQTPAYNTTRTMEATTRLIHKLHGSGLLDAVLVHDIGVLRSLRALEGVELWWDRFSFNRDIVPNGYLIDFLLAHHVARVEVTRPADVDELAARGCGVLLYGHGPQIVSFGRVCYTEYFLNEPCESKILCADQQPLIASVDKVRLQYVADGYTLLDKEEPLVTLPRLDQGQVSKIGGFTAYIRNPQEIPALDALTAAMVRAASDVDDI